MISRPHKEENPAAKRFPCADFREQNIFELETQLLCLDMVDVAVGPDEYHSEVKIKLLTLSGKQE